MTARFAPAAAAALIGALALAAPAPLAAHGNVSCNAGPKTEWKSLDALKAKLTQEGWKVTKAHPSKDCYEVYGIMPDGKKVESFWHPVTFEKVQVLQRGKVIFPAG
jgi:hypothetical protein